MSQTAEQKSEALVYTRDVLRQAASLAIIFSVAATKEKFEAIESLSNHYDPMEVDMVPLGLAENFAANIEGAYPGLLEHIKKTYG